MTKYFKRISTRLLSMAFLCGAAQVGVRAELIIGLTAQNSLISFDSATPGTLSSTVGLSGVLAGDTLVGIDRRPTFGALNGTLYGLGVNPGSGAGRIYTIDTLTGLATAVAALNADPADTAFPTPFTSLMGTQFGIDFDPVADRLRVVSDTGQNLRIDVATGLVSTGLAAELCSAGPELLIRPLRDGISLQQQFHRRGQHVPDWGRHVPPAGPFGLFPRSK